MLANPNSRKLLQTPFELFLAEYSTRNIIILVELIWILTLLIQKICFFFIILLKPQQINNSWCLLDPAGLALFSKFYDRVPA